MAAQASGRVLKLHVVDNQQVKAGDPLIDIDSRDTDTRAPRRVIAYSLLAKASGTRTQPCEAG